MRDLGMERVNGLKRLVGIRVRREVNLLREAELLDEGAVARYPVVDDQRDLGDVLPIGIGALL